MNALVPLPAHAEPVEVGAERALRFAGYAALFGRRDAGRDTIRPGAFARSLASRAGPIPLLWQHRADLRIGWIELAKEDARGLRVIAALAHAESAPARALRQGGVSGLSFGYRARAFHRTRQGRELIDIDLFEVSLVTRPMQHAARVHLITPSSRRKPGSLETRFQLASMRPAVPDQVRDDVIFLSPEER